MRAAGQILRFNDLRCVIKAYLPPLRETRRVTPRILKQISPAHRETKLDRNGAKDKYSRCCCGSDSADKITIVSAMLGGRRQMKANKNRKEKHRPSPKTTSQACMPVGAHSLTSSTRSGRLIIVGTPAIYYLCHVCANPVEDAPIRNTLPR